MSRIHRPVGPVTADEGKTLETLRNLWPHLWPADRPELKRAVILALAALILGKVLTVFLPFVYKWSTDLLAGGPAPEKAQLLAVPVLLVVAWGVVRIASVGFNQLRDALFAGVGQHAVRGLATQTFRHLHALSLRYHLTRRTGGLSRVVERGAKGIETIVRISILAGVPTLVEFALMAAVILWEFDWIYVGVIVVTTWLYVWFSVRASEWRIGIRRDMNDADTDSMSKAVDSLLNFETVKYFTAEELEAARYDRAMAKYETAAIRTYTSLSWLNFGQGVIFSAGMAACMALSAWSVMKGEQTVGHFVMINALMIQLSVPLNFIGTLYRDIKQSLVDIESLFKVLDQPAEVSDKPNAAALKVTEAAVRFEDVAFSYDPERQILKGVTFEVPAGKTVAVVGPSGAGKDTLIAAARDALPGLVIVRRVITRPEAAGGEDFEGVTPKEFARRREAGDFALDWQVHGLSYGIPAEALALRGQGRDVLFNGSRAALERGAALYPDMVVIRVTAPAAVLMERLLARGRETRADIEARLARASFAVPEGLQVAEVVNDGPVAQGVARFLAALQPPVSG